jgi:membrane protein DedA with SNARE-associated domain
VPEGSIFACVALATGDWSLQVAEFEAVIHKLGSIAPHWVYLVVALGVAIENIFPPVPADTFVVLGAFLSAEGRVTGSGVFLATWSMNTTTALLSYGVARRWGRGVLDTRPGRWLLRPRQLERLAALYNAHGSKIIFFCRFLPAFRALVPVFAGISHLAVWRTALPIALASAIWYGVLIYAGGVLGKNWRVILETLNNVNMLLLIIAAVVGAGLTFAWWKTRHQPHEAGGGEGTEL